MRCHLSQVVAQLLYPTSDRNREAAREQSAPVVFLRYPTSNRNCSSPYKTDRKLYISFILHQTATITRSSILLRVLYISFILHQTATFAAHQLFHCCCISPLSYIKPQLIPRRSNFLRVVFLLYPTSNRNKNREMLTVAVLYFSFILHQTATIWLTAFRCPRLYFSFILHQTATERKSFEFSDWLYFSFILHQTATLLGILREVQRCISPLSYIKPQHRDAALLERCGCISPLSYIKPQPIPCAPFNRLVVFLLYPTSNRNLSFRRLLISITCTF